MAIMVNYSNSWGPYTVLNISISGFYKKKVPLQLQISCYFLRYCKWFTTRIKGMIG